MSWTTKIPQAARNYLDANRLDEVECMISDLPGIARGKAVPAAKWEKMMQFHLPESIFFSDTYRWLGRSGRRRWIYRTRYDS